MFNIPTLSDLFASMAILSLLAWSYGYLRRKLRSPAMTDLVLGCMFGAIAYLEMYTPLELAAGLIVDLRHVPVLLAGAYLGWVGMVPCVAIAIVARLYIGGVGAEAAVLGLMLSGLIGVAWAEMLRDRTNRGAGMLAALAIFGAVRLIALVVLPPETAWFVASVIVPYLIPLEILSIVAIGSLLERERASIRGEAIMRASANIDPASGLLTMEGLERSYAQMSSDDAPSRGTGLILVRLRKADWVSRQFGAQALDQVRAALRLRLERDLPRSDLLALTSDGHIAIMLTDRDGRSQDLIAQTMMRDVAQRPVTLADGSKLRIGVEMGQSWDLKPRPLAVQIAEARGSLKLNDQVEGRQADQPAELLEGTDALFARAGHVSG